MEGLSTIANHHTRKEEGESALGIADDPGWFVLLFKERARVSLGYGEMKNSSPRSIFSISSLPNSPSINIEYMEYRSDVSMIR